MSNTAAGDARGLGASGRVKRAWKRLSPERQLSALAAIGLFVSLFLPWYQDTVIARDGAGGGLQARSVTLTGWGAFSFVEVVILLIAVLVLVLLFRRAEGRPLPLPGGDGASIVGAGSLASLMVVWGIVDQQGTTGHGEYVTASGVEWGIFVALAVAFLLTYAGSRVRAVQHLEPAAPGQDDGGVPFWGPPGPTGAAPGGSSRAARPSGSSQAARPGESSAVARPGGSSQAARPSGSSEAARPGGPAPARMEQPTTRAGAARAATAAGAAQSAARAARVPRPVAADGSPTRVSARKPGDVSPGSERGDDTPLRERADVTRATDRSDATRPSDREPDQSQSPDTHISRRDRATKPLGPPVTPDDPPAMSFDPQPKKPSSGEPPTMPLEHDRDSDP